MSFEDFTEDERELYLEALREGTTPFDRFVSRGDIEDVIDIPSSRKMVDRAVFRAIQQTQLDQSTRLIPIIGEAGTGKTHTYWAYKDLERRIKKAERGELDEELDMKVPSGWTIVYVPSPPAAHRILLHVYSCMIDELGADVLGEVANKLVERWGGKKKKHLGLFGSADIDEVIQNGIREFPGIFADCIKCLVIYAMDKDRRGLAERWLLGEDLTDEELKTLGVNSIIEDDDICLAMIKLISEFTDYTIVLYFDELESPYRMHGPEAERKFLEVLKRLYNEVKNLVIIIAVLKDIWPRILEVADMPLKSRMEPERELEKWSLDDLKLYFAKSMLNFWTQQNLPPPPDPLFPLNDEVLAAIYNKTDGNQRSIIKLIRIFVEKIAFGDMTLEELIKDQKITPIAKPKIEESEINKEIIKMAKEAAARSEKAKEELAKQIEKMMQEEEFIIDVNPSSIAGAALKIIRLFGEHYGKNHKVEVEFRFTVGKREITLAGAVECDAGKFGLDVPSVKSFDRSGGVSAFYAAKRLSQALENGVIDGAILIVPRDTKGQKYQSILKQNPQIKVVEINNAEGEDLLRSAAASKLTPLGYKIASIVFPDIPEVEEEKPEEITENTGA